MTEEEVLTLLFKQGSTDLREIPCSSNVIHSLVEQELITARTLKKYRAINSNTRTWDFVTECMLTNAGVKRVQSSQD